MKPERPRLSRRLTLARDDAVLSYVELADRVTEMSGEGITPLELEALENGRATMSPLLPHIAGVMIESGV